MKHLDFSFLSELPRKELVEKLSEARREYVRLKMSVALQQERNKKKKPQQRKYIARILTALSHLPT